MQTVTINQAKTNFSQLIEKVLQGEEIVITKTGKTIAKLILYRRISKTRKPGLFKDKIWMSDDFTEEDEEINKIFYGE